MQDGGHGKPRTGYAVNTEHPDTPPHLLMLNAAEGRLQLLVAREDPAAGAGYTLLCAQSLHAPSQGAELLAPALDNTLERLRLSPRSLTRIAAVRGPGSFTGLRLVLATASGLARAVGASLAGMDYLPVLAHNAALILGNALPDGTGKTVWVLTHARKRLLHLQAFAPFAAPLPHALPQPLSDILVLDPEAAAEAIIHNAGPGTPAPLLLGSGLEKNREALCAVFDRAATGTPRPILLPALFNHPSPEALLDLAPSLVWSADDVAPLYVRPPDAEDNLEHIARSLRLDPAAARARLDALTSGPVLVE